MALRVVAHVHEQVGCVRGNPNALEQLARRRPLLRHDRIRVAGAAVRVPDRVCAAFRDPRQECLGRERPVDVRVRAQAVAGDSAHNGEKDPKKLLGCFFPIRRPFPGEVCKRFLKVREGARNPSRRTLDSSPVPPQPIRKPWSCRTRCQTSRTTSPISRSSRIPRSPRTRPKPRRPSSRRKRSKSRSPRPRPATRCDCTCIRSATARS